MNLKESSLQSPVADFHDFDSMESQEQDCFVIREVGSKGTDQGNEYKLHLSSCQKVRAK